MVGLSPSEDWDVRVAVTGSPRLCSSASWSAFSAEAVDVTVKLTVPAAAS